MIDTIIKLTEDEFDAQYKLRTNHLNPAATWAYGQAGGCLFETYGQELAFVRSQDPRTVWTLIDGDDGAQYVLSGFHLLNRIGYLISTLPVPEETTIHVHISMPSEEVALATTHTPGPWEHGDNGLIYGQCGEDDVEAPFVCDVIQDSAMQALGMLAPVEAANARRICAAVNACEGISTQALEQGVVGQLLEALKGCLFALDGNQDGCGPSKTQAIAAATAATSKAARRAK